MPRDERETMRHYCIFWWRDRNGSLESNSLFGEWDAVQQLVEPMKAVGWKIIITLHRPDTVATVSGYEAAKAEYDKYVEDNVPF
jgi:hypothetical protein